MITRDNYYDYSAISNSALSEINPAQAGSPQKFMKFFNESREVKSSLSLERGRLLHLWSEYPEKFVVSEIEKPSEQISSWVEAVYRGMKQGIYTSKKEAILETKVLLDIQKTLKNEDVILEKFKQNIDYYSFLEAADGKICLSKETKVILTSCIKSLERNKVFVELTSNPLTQKEVPLTWETMVAYNGENQYISCKGLLDFLCVDHEKKTVTIGDLKTTAKSCFTFNKTVDAFRYHRQLYFYKQGVVSSFPETEKYEFSLILFPVETSGMFLSTSYILTKDWLDEADEEIKELMQRIVFHTVNNQWDYSKEEVENNYLIPLPKLIK